MIRRQSIGVGIIGAGHFGAVHARAVAAAEGLHLAAACREDAEGLAAFTARHGGRGYRNWQDLLDDPEVEAVAIALPHALHEEVAIASAHAGRHILLEKPMAPTAAACGRIAAAVESSGVRLLVGHVMHFALPCLRAREVIESGEIGRPVLGISGMIKLWMESNRRPWHLTLETGGGMLMTAGIHALDRLVLMMGRPVTAVGAMTGSLFHAQEADDSALIGLRFEGGMGQVQSVGYRDGAMSFAMDLVCEGGTLHLDFERGVSLGRGGRWADLPQSLEPDWMHQAVVREWLALRDSIRRGVPVPVTVAHARHIIEVIEAAGQSAALRREVEIVHAA